MPWAPTDSRNIAVLAFADEVCADPSLLAGWAASFTAHDPVTLILHPGGLGATQVSEQVTEAANRAGLTDDEESADLVALTGPLSADDEAELVRRCSAVLSRREPDVPFVALPRVDERTLTSVRDLIAQSSTTVVAPPAPQPRHVATINDRWQVIHRGTPEDVGVLRQIFVDESYSLSPLAGWPGLARFRSAKDLGRRPLIIDCGANIGASTLYFGMSFQDAVIVAVEPEHDNFALLRQNTAAMASVEPINKAIASSSGTVRLYDPGWGAWGYRTGDQDAEFGSIGEVDAISVADIVSAHPDTEPFLLKVDIEGAEADLFSAPSDAFYRFPLVIVELHDWMLPGRHTSRSFLSWHLGQERDLVQLGENTFSLACALCDPLP